MGGVEEWRSSAATLVKTEPEPILSEGPGRRRCQGKPPFHLSASQSMDSNAWCPRRMAAMISSGSVVHVKGIRRVLVPATFRLMAA